MHSNHSSHAAALQLVTACLGSALKTTCEANTLSTVAEALECTVSAIGTIKQDWKHDCGLAGS